MRQFAQIEDPMSRLKTTWYFIDQYFEAVVTGITLIAMAFLVFAQVVMRYVFHAPMSWSDEIAVYCMIWSVYLSASWAVKERAHIRMFNLIMISPQPLSQWLIYFSDAVWFAFSIFIGWQGILLDYSLWQQKYESPVLGIDQKWPYMVVAFGFAMMTVRLAQTYYRWIKYGEPLLGSSSLDEESTSYE